MAEELRGNGTPRLLEVIDAYGDVLSNPGPVSASRLKKWGKENRNLRSSALTLCLFRPEVALCGGEGSADFRLCRPYECRNSTMTPGQRARVELRRRDEMEMAPILRRSAEKLAAAMPEIVEEFKDTARHTLAELASAEDAAYVRDALSGSGGEQ